jgi:hypothetical protein
MNTSYHLDVFNVQYRKFRPLRSSARQLSLGFGVRSASGHIAADHYEPIRLGTYVMNMQDSQPEIQLTLFQMSHLERRIAEQRARVAQLKEIGAPIDHPEDLLRVLQRSHESLRRFLVRITSSA